MIHIALYKGTGPVAAAIKWQTRSSYSHAALVLDDGRTVEAWHQPVLKGGKVMLNETPTAIHKGVEVDLYRVEVGPEVEDRIKSFALAQVGKPYDFRMVFRFVDRAGETTGSKDKWFCSELVFASYDHAGVKLLERVEAWEVSPGLLSLSPLLTYVTTHNG